MSTHKIAGVYLAFDRADYTKETIGALEKCVDADDIDWFIFQDGIENPLSGKVYATEDDLNSVKKIIDTSSLNIVEFERSDWNGSIPQQKWKAHQVFKKGYDTIFFFEDDLLVSKYYLRLLKIMAHQFPDDLGFLYSNTNSGSDLRQLAYCGDARLWGYYMNSHLYESIEDDYNNYYSEIQKLDYNSRELFKGVKINFPTRMHDVTITRLCKKYGAKKFMPYVTRATYIGKKGKLAYRTDAFWERKKMDRQPKKIQYPKDATLESFNVGSQRP